MSATEEADRLIAEGNRAEEAGNFSQACERYRQAVVRAPDYPKAQVNLGIGLEALGDAAGATRCYEKALASDPADPYANYNLGKLLFTQGALPRAEQLLERALASRPEFPEARIVYGHVLYAQGKLEAAASELGVGSLQRPHDVGCRVALFHILEARGEFAAAASQLEAALEIEPQWPEALYDYGTTLMKLGRDADAESALRRVIALDPGFYLAYRMLANLLHRQGRVEEMLELCRAGRAREPASFELESFELLGLNFTESASAEALFRAHRAFGERLENAYPKRFAFPGDRAAPRERLRIGYVSSDFNYHPVGLFLLPVLERRDRSRFEAYCYATSTKRDAFTGRLAAQADVWRDASALSDAQLADTIYRDRIDVLVDLAGHSGVSRLGVFAQQPAPVQVGWLGYLNTTGLSRIRYRITDRFCDPPGLTERLHTESLIRLPHSQWCYRPFVSVAGASQPPLERNGFVTFGSFNQVAKLSSTTRSLWAKILKQVPDSRLAVHGVPQGAAADRLLGDLAAAGIAPARIKLVPFSPVEEYLRSYDEVDIALDPTPYSGGTTTCDALWMGVPVLTAPGSRPASRSAASVLTSIGLTDWIAAGAEDYVRRTVEFAGRRDTLSALRAALRERLRASPLMDEESFTRALEQAYRRVWEAGASAP
ncbi:MAG TPA: tetratricopeptide repeat protein [Burkholderiales bacterium]|jgi:predicted O-linked N-acetylglucosamine transferase (SPINDLY family)|nr:tetratricopeptide repeat protein [Burkholderiales bacterium]